MSNLIIVIAWCLIALLLLALLVITILASEECHRLDLAQTRVEVYSVAPTRMLGPQQSRMSHGKTS